MVTYPPKKSVRVGGPNGYADLQMLHHMPMRGLLHTGQDRKEHREFQGNGKQVQNWGRFRAVLVVCCQQSQCAFDAAQT